MNHPIINIEYNRFLDPIFLGWIRSQEQYKNWIAPSKDEVLKNAEGYKRAWKIYGSRILSGLTEITGLMFKRNHIDVHVVTGNPRAFSFPIIVKSRYEPIEFVQVLAHELIHCLFKDNNIHSDQKDPYPNNPHILVHAVLKYIYLDCLNEPDMLRMNKERSLIGDGNDEYKTAWDFVEKVDYRFILRAFKKKVS
jgi:hypothetical protein